MFDEIDGDNQDVELKLITFEQLNEQLGLPRPMSQSEFIAWLNTPQRRTIKQRFMYWRFRIRTWIWILKGKPPYDV